MTDNMQSQTPEGGYDLSPAAQSPTPPSPPPFKSPPAGVNTADVRQSGPAAGPARPNAVKTDAEQAADDARAEEEAADIRENRALAAVAYMGPLVLVPLVFGKTSPFVRYHTNQGFLLFVAEIFVWAALEMLAIPALVIPPLPPVLGLVAFGAWILFFVFSLRGIAAALGGRKGEIPIIGIHKVVE